MSNTKNEILKLKILNALYRNITIVKYCGINYCMVDINQIEIVLDDIFSEELE